MKKTVLIAEDEPLIRETLALQLRTHGIDVHTARDGKEAIAFLDSQRPDLLVVDMLMPKVDGLAVLEHLKVKHSDVPSIIVTNLSKDFDAVKSAALGVQEVVIKSDISVQGLAEKICRYVESEEAEHRSAETDLAALIWKYGSENDIPLSEFDALEYRRSLSASGQEASG